MSLNTHSPTFAANIAFVSDKTFDKIMDYCGAKLVCWDRQTLGEKQFVSNPASYTKNVVNCTAAVVTGTGQLSHLDPANRTNLEKMANNETQSVLKFLPQSFKDLSVVIAGGKNNFPKSPVLKNSTLVRNFNKQTEKFSHWLINLFKNAQASPTVFIKQKSVLAMGYIGKDINTISPALKDTVFITLPCDELFMEEKLKLIYPHSEEQLVDFLNSNYGEWYVAPQDKLVWVNEHLDITDPHFIEEIPRRLYDKHA